MLAVCCVVGAEGEALRQRVALEQAHVGELEGLLAIARADQVLVVTGYCLSGGCRG